MKYFPSSFCECGCILKTLAFAVGNDTELQSGRLRVECGNLHCALYTVQQYLKKVSHLKIKVFLLTDSDFLFL